MNESALLPDVTKSTTDGVRLLSLAGARPSGQCGGWLRDGNTY